MTDWQQWEKDHPGQGLDTAPADVKEAAWQAGGSTDYNQKVAQGVPGYQSTNPSITPGSGTGPGTPYAQANPGQTTTPPASPPAGTNTGTTNEPTAAEIAAWAATVGFPVWVGTMYVSEYGFLPHTLADFQTWLNNKGWRDPSTGALSLPGTGIPATVAPTGVPATAGPNNTSPAGEGGSGTGTGSGTDAGGDLLGNTTQAGLAQPSNQNMLLYVVGAIAALALVGGRR